MIGFGIENVNVPPIRTDKRVVKVNSKEFYHGISHFFTSEPFQCVISLLPVTILTCSGVLVSLWGRVRAAGGLIYEHISFRVCAELVSKS